MDLSRGNCNCHWQIDCTRTSAGIYEKDEMFDVMGDIISGDAEGDSIGGQSSNEQYDDLFASLRS